MPLAGYAGCFPKRRSCERQQHAPVCHSCGRPVAYLRLPAAPHHPYDASLQRHAPQVRLCCIAYNRVYSSALGHAVCNTKSAVICDWPATQTKSSEEVDYAIAISLLLRLCLCCSSHGHIRTVGCDCRRSSHLASTVVQQFKHAVATGTHRLSDTSGPLPDLNGSLGSNISLEAGSPADSTSSAPQLGADSPRLAAQEADHVVVNMDSEDSARYVHTAEPCTYSAEPCMHGNGFCCQFDLNCLHL